MQGWIRWRRGFVVAPSMDYLSTISPHPHAEKRHEHPQDVLRHRIADRLDHLRGLQRRRRHSRGLPGGHQGIRSPGRSRRRAEPGRGAGLAVLPRHESARSALRRDDSHVRRPGQRHPCGHPGHRGQRDPDDVRRLRAGRRTPHAMEWRRRRGHAHAQRRLRRIPRGQTGGRRRRGAGRSQVHDDGHPRFRSGDRGHDRRLGTHRPGRPAALPPPLRSAGHPGHGRGR